MSDSAYESSFVVTTDAGMCALWQPEHFSRVDDLDSWEVQVADDAALMRHAQAGAFVPLNVGGDGSFQVVVRQGGLTDRESRFRLVSSDPYLLVSKGTVHLGGLENVGPYVGGAHAIRLSAGRYSVRIHLIDWKAEPGAATKDGEPTEEALPDFVVEASPESSSPPSYRTAVETFEPSS